MKRFNGLESNRGGAPQSVHPSITRPCPRIRRRLLGRILAGVTFSIAVLVLGWVGMGWIPTPVELAHSRAASVEFLDRNGTPLRVLANPQGLVARGSAESDTPSWVENATIAAEDARFRQHGGMDFLATVRALGQLAWHRRIISGASTITQQLIKLAHPRPRTWTTKLLEAAQAMRLERDWDKDRILHAYLERLDYGNRCQGIREAARHYFGKQPQDLDLAESAFLAGLPQAPTRLNPRSHFEQAKARQQWVLRRMESLGMVSPDERATAEGEPLTLVPITREFAAPHFVDWLRRAREAGAKSGPIRTTLDLPLQSDCEGILRAHLAPLRDRQVGQGAVVVLDNRTDELLVMVGGVDWIEHRQGQVNAATARRSPGSALKPFTYLLALEAGATASDVIPDVPTEFPTPTGIFRPLNYDHHCNGPIRLRLALANSLNIPAVRVLNTWSSPAKLRQRLVDCGITTLDRSDNDYGLGLTLGNVEVQLLELVNVYATLARMGEWHPIRVLREQASSIVKRRVADPAACWLIADILADADARSMAFGYDSPLRFDFPMACKTGTSSDFRDNWAMGYTPEFTVGVWVGNLDGHPMSGVSGVTGAGPVLHEVMELLHQRSGTSWFSRPAMVVERWVDPWTGHELGERNGAVREYFLAGHLPSPSSTEDRDDHGRVRLDAIYHDWLTLGDGKPHGSMFALKESLNPASFRIVEPLIGTVYLLDQDLTARQQRIRLRASGTCRWECTTLKLTRVGGEVEVELGLGHHRIEAIDGEGRRVETWIEVRGM